MTKFTLTDKPPAHTLVNYMDTSRKRKIVDGWLDAAMALVQRFLRGEETDEDYFSHVTLILARSIAKLDTCIRACENFNRNLQIRAHVITSAAGRAWARGVLGEANIKRWQARYDVGGWPDKKPAGSAKTQLKSAPRKTPKSYEWKPITLPSIAYWCPFKPLNTTFPDLPDPFAKPIFTWPREKRALKPAIFWPDELEEDYEADPALIYKAAQHRSYAQALEAAAAAAETSTDKSNNNLVPGARGESSRSEAGIHNAPGSRATSIKPEGHALDPGSSPGTDGGRVKVPERKSKPP